MDAGEFEMNTVTLYVIGKVFRSSAQMCAAFGCPADQTFTWHNEFETVEQCLAEKEKRINWLQLNYEFKYKEEPDYICAESLTS